MASMIALPRESHLKEMFQMFLFLKGEHNGVDVFNPVETKNNQNQFPTADWSATPCSL